MRLSQLHPNDGQIEGVPRNPRLITEEEFAKLKKSLKNFHKMLALRPIVVDEGMNILGGNMRYQALKKLAEDGAVCQVFDIRGALVSYYKFEDEIPDEWVKVATDLTADEKMEFIVKDNEERGQWDYDLLANEWDAEKLREWDIEAANWDADVNTEEKPDNEYSRKVEIPTYEPSGKLVNINECIDTTKYEELCKRIKATDMPSDVREFLIHAAQRHIVFDYEKIADFYANAGKNIQQLFEDSALVIIDIGGGHF